MNLYKTRRLRGPIPDDKKKIIARICELYRSGIEIKHIATKLGISMPRVCETLTVFYFPYKGDDPVCIVLKSKV